jgi:hypothetical protein
MPDQFLRKANGVDSLPADVQCEAGICLLRVIFGIPDDHDEETLCRLKVNYLGETYAVKELAADLGVSVFSVYKMFSEERPVRFATVLRILDFIKFKDHDDLRLIDFINQHAGCTAMPNHRGVDHLAARKVVMAAYKAIEEEREE